MDSMQVKTNAIYCGDSLDVLRYFPEEFVDLIYLDPPFSSGRIYNIIFGSNLEKKAFDDRWKGGINHYVEYMRERLELCHRVLNDKGSIYLHCDYHASHYLKTIMDDIFGYNNFKNEIIWKRKDAQSFANRYGTTHDIILFYSKSKNYTYNKVLEEYLPLSQETADTWYKYEEIVPKKIVNRFSKVIEKGTIRRYNKGDLSAPGDRQGTAAHYKWNGKYPPKGRHWQYQIVVMKQLEKEKRLTYSKTGRVYEKRYLDETKGTPPQDIWMDIPMLRGLGKHSEKSEWLEYPTQKPERLLERIIRISSNEKDIVLDPFCGCGTTLVAAHRLKRKWIGIDISPTACKVMKNRLGNVKKMGLFAVKNVPIIGLPKTESDLRKLQYFEFENWVCDVLFAIQTKKAKDMGIDGYIPDGTPIQAKQMNKVGRPLVDNFETAIKRAKKNRGIIVAFGFTRDAYEEVARIKKEGIEIILRTVKELLEMGF